MGKYEIHDALRAPDLRPNMGSEMVQPICYIRYRNYLHKLNIESAIHFITVAKSKMY